MHGLFTEASGITRDVIGAAIEIHHALRLTEGVSRLILPGANLE